MPLRYSRAGAGHLRRIAACFESSTFAAGGPPASGWTMPPWCRGPAFDVDAAVEAVRPICADVAERGAAALAELLAALRPRGAAELPGAGERAARRRPTGSTPSSAAAFEVVDRPAAAGQRGRARATPATEVPWRPGRVVTQRMVPVGRVGLYVPGGLAPLASSVIMNVVPAQVAGVASIALASPPQRDFGGLPHPASSRCVTCSGSRRCTRSAAPRRSPCSRTGCPGCARR